MDEFIKYHEPMNGSCNEFLISHIYTISVLAMSVQTEVAGTALAEAVAAAVGADRSIRGAERPTLHIAVHDLEWSPSAESCASGDSNGHREWRWTSANGPARRRGKDADYSPWPFVFSGLAAPQLRFPSGPISDQGPALFAVVRLWVVPNTPCSEPHSVHGAIRTALAAAGPRGKVSTLNDPSRWLLGTRVEFDAPQGYLGGALLVRWGP